jgi:hypothetical protein
MKILSLLISFVFIGGLVKAQVGPPPMYPNDQRAQNIEALKVAFISRDLNLTPYEAERFWPLYNQYSNELQIAFRDNMNVIDRDERVLNIRKHYNALFIRIIGPERTNNMFGAEARFRQLLIRAMRRQQHIQPNRPPGRFYYRQN